MRRGAILLEQVVAIGLLGLALLMVAASLAQSARSGRALQHGYEAQVLAQNLLEKQRAGSVSLMSVGSGPPVTGQFSDGTSYTATLSVYGPSGLAGAAGLGDADLKGLKVTVRWNDVTGSRQASCESLLARLPR